MGGAWFRLSPSDVAPGWAAITEDALDCGQEILPPRAASASQYQAPSAHLAWGGERMSSGPWQLRPAWGSWPSSIFAYPGPPRDPGAPSSPLPGPRWGTLCLDSGCLEGKLRRHETGMGVDRRYTASYSGYFGIRGLPRTPQMQRTASVLCHKEPKGESSQAPELLRLAPGVYRTPKA